MGEVISLSQYRKDRISGASRGNPADANIRYGLTESENSEAENDRVRHIAEFQRRELDAPGDDPERL